MLFERSLTIFTSFKDTKSMDDIWPSYDILEIVAIRRQRDMET